MAEASLRQRYEAGLGELQRSDRVQRQLREVLDTVRRRNEELATEAERLRAAAREDPRYALLTDEASAGRAAFEAAQAEHLALQRAAEERRAEAAAQAALAEARSAERAEAEAAVEALEQRGWDSERRREKASTSARCMVDAGTLLRAEEQAEKMNRRLEEQEAETAKLRQALIDAWAARADPVDASAAQPASALEDLDGVEEELRWLSRMQQESAAEVHRTQQLERQEAALQARLRDLSEEKASLQSARVDLGNAGGTLREAIASQSEGWVRRVDDLERARKLADQDRTKLMTECADLQARLDGMTSELSAIQDLEGRHRQQTSDRRRLADESSRLREVNGALGVLLLGDHAPPPSPGDEAAAVAEAITRVLQLQKRLNGRQEAQATEKHRLLDRIRDLERQAAQPDASLMAKPKAGSYAPPSRTSASARPAPSASSAVGDALRGGLGKLREAAVSAVL